MQNAVPFRQTASLPEKVGFPVFKAAYDRSTGRPSTGSGLALDAGFTSLAQRGSRSFISSKKSPLYTPAERERRDRTVWTLVQGILAPLQFVVFLVSLVLVLRALATGHGIALANASVVAKTVALYTIMITGSIWEREVFGQWLFARPFFWEDVVSMLVLALHTAVLVALATNWLTPRERLLLALAAYASYVVNATQFLLKLRAARLNAATDSLAARPLPRGAHD